ncbi:MFS transporter [Cellulomonas sp. P22]|uniref:MFS transporter n=1 Tax=Cellulomonas sp. P22 TaxID=3373189 RepID=UPI0037B16CD8
MSQPRLHPGQGTTRLTALLGRQASKRSLERTRWVLMGLFTLNGLMFSSWLARIPTVRDTLDLTTGQLGVVLLAGSIGSLATATVSGILVTRYGGKIGLYLSTAGFALAYVLLGLGPALGSVPVLAVGIFLIGVSFSIGNVPLNVETAAVERRMGRTVLPQFHAAFSIGAVLGSLVGAAASHLEVSLLVQFAVTALVGTLWRLAAVPHAVLDSVPVRERVAVVDIDAGTPAPPARARGGVRSALDAWREPRTLLIGVVIMAAALSEGSANDWLALAVVDGFERTEAVGAVVFGVFVGAMTLVRLLGTRLIDRLGRVPVLRASGVVSLVGLLLFGFAPTLELATLGVVGWGFGAALAVPLGIAAASDDPMRAAGRVAVVSTFSSVASLGAPPLLGLAAESMGARHALVLITVAMVASVLLSRSVTPLLTSHGPATVRAGAPSPT